MTRLNLSALRKLRAVPDSNAQLGTPGLLQPVTRRMTLQAGALLAAAPSGFGDLLCRWVTRVTFAFDGRQASFLLNGVPAWTIDPSRFSGRARLSVREDSRSIALRLRDARYPGSSVPADLRCTVTKERLYWAIDLRLDFGGFRSSTEIEPWLAGEQVLSSRIEWQGPLLTSRQLKLGVALEGSAQARFSPNWTLALERPVGASASLSGGFLPASRLEIRLPEPGQPSLAAEQLKKRAAIVAERGHHTWPALVKTGPLRGGELEIDEQAFSRLEIESHDGVEGRHVFYLATSQARSEVARIRPGADYRLLGGDLLTLPLRDLRLAGFAGPHGSERALLASQAGDPLWLDAGSTRLKLGDSHDSSVLEILESSGGAPRFQLAPALLATLTPIEGAVALETPPAAPTRVALGVHDGDAPVGERCGTCAPRGDGALDVRLPGHSISVLRPEDLLVVRFELVNLEVRKNCFKKPHLAVRDDSQEAFLIVHLPPQSIAERAFLEAPAGSETPRIDCMESRLSRGSRLAFCLKDRAVEIPYNLPALLHWDPEIWKPAKMPATRPLAEIIAAPTDRQTDIEFPWRLHLSPDDATVWAHSLEPVTRDGRTELWHTRLNLERPWEAEWPTVRAVWADQDPLPGSACPDGIPPAVPFRTSLTDGQRWKIVLATHEKKLKTAPNPVDAHFFAVSALGAWSDLRGDWPCTPATACNSLARWDHLATMGRDQKVILEERGFLVPTGHKVTLVQETVRELFPVEVTIDGTQRWMFIAFLRQRFYVKLKEPVRTYGNWDFPHRTIEILDKRTPILNDPRSPAGGCLRGCYPSQTEARVFWPTVGDAAFRFRLRGTDYAGTEQTWEQPLLFVEQTCDSKAELASLVEASHFRPAIDHYNASPRRFISFAGESIAIAPSLRKGDTEVAVREIKLKVIDLKKIPVDPCAAGYLDPNSEALKLHKDPCEPPFWPSLESIQASVPAVETFLGSSEPADWWPLSIGCDDAFESFATLIRKGSTSAAFHESSDRSGGSLGPSPKITHLSRRFGPVGLGTRGPEPPQPVANGAPAAVAAVAVTSVSAGEFFDSSATLFGTISLAEIIGEITPDDGTVPALLSLLTPFADGPGFLQQSLTWETQSFEDVQLGGILAFEPRKEDPKTRFAIDGSFSLWIGQPESARFAMQGKLEHFAIRIGFPSAGARVNFNSVTYQALSDGRTSFDLDLGQVEFLGALAFIQRLAERLKEFLRKELGVEVDLQPKGLTVWMPPINLPTLNFGMVTIKNLSIRSWARLPFTPNPIELGFAFGRADAPCELSVGIFGGTAYALVLLDTDKGGLRRFEMALEFGVLREVSFGPAHGRVYLLGGIFFSLSMGPDGRVVVLRAFVRAGGSVDVLGLITAYIDLYIGLRHESNGARSFLVGEASLTIGFKIVFVKYSATLRRTERIAGSASSGGSQESGLLFRRSSYASLEAGRTGDCTPLLEPPPLKFEQAICKDDWSAYWAAFAPAEGALHAA